MLERAACAVTHAGMGATHKSLGRGVPVAAVSLGRDQLEVARRVELSGAGIRLPRRRLQPDRLRADVREAMSRRRGTQRLAHALRGVGRAVTAAGLLELQLVGSEKPDPRQLTCGTSSTSQLTTTPSVVDGSKSHRQRPQSRLCALGRRAR